MRNLHRILRAAILAATLIAGMSALPVAQAPAQAAAASHRAHAVSGAQYLQIHRQVSRAAHAQGGSQAKHALTSPGLTGPRPSIDGGFPDAGARRLHARQGPRPSSARHSPSLRSSSRPPPPRRPGRARRAQPRPSPVAIVGES